MRWRGHAAQPRYGNRERPGVGDVVAWERRAWEVMHVSDAALTEDEQERISHYAQPWRDRMRPYRVTLRRLHGEKHKLENDKQEIGLRAPHACSEPFPIYRDGRVPLCSCHSHPWPCLEADQQAEARKQAAKAEREMQLLPGCCPACQEPVTSRQQSIVFAGEYLRNPLSPPDPAFHLRSKCYGAAAAYEESWVNAWPGRERSLLTIRCEGTVVVHGDGSAECFGADDSDCPTVHASHRCYSACYMQSHGCGQGCSRQGHPGTRVAGRPKHPRDAADRAGRAS